MVFRYDAALDLVFKEEFTEQTDQEGEEAARQQTVVNESRRKRPRYGNYELLFPEGEEEQEREPEEEELLTRPIPAAAPEQFPFNHPAIKKGKGRSTNQGDN